MPLGLTDLAFHGGPARSGFWPPAATLLAAGWALREKMRGIEPERARG